MPNWCECELTVKGKADAIRTFTDGLKRTTDDDGSKHIAMLEAYVPMPESLREVSSGSDAMGFEIMYTDKWRIAADYPWIIAAHGARPQDREATWLAFVTARGKQGVDEAALVLTAERYKANVDTYGVPTWYEWAQREWGSKWGDCRTSLASHESGVVRLNFESPWSPPMAGLEKVSQRFPDLTFSLRYFEGGMGFKGRATFKAGATLTDVSSKYTGPRGG